MPMRAALPGTGHSTTLHKDEEAILRAISNTPGVTKLEPLFFKWTGATQTRLRIQKTSARTGKDMLQAWLFIGHGRRFLLIGVRPLATLETVREALAQSLRRFNVEVYIRAS